MPCTPELCVSCGEYSFGLIRDLCPECREPHGAQAICKEKLAECITCKKCERREEPCSA